MDAHNYEHDPSGGPDFCFICHKFITTETGVRMLFPPPETPELMCFECLGKFYFYGPKWKAEQMKRQQSSDRNARNAGRPTGDKT
jgi:hypothetical protein